MQTMTQTPRTRPLTAKQRTVLEILAAGGVIVENPGMRGFMKSVTVVAAGQMVGTDIPPAVMRSLFSPLVWENPGLIEPFTPRNRRGEPFSHFFRITRAGREALKIR